MSLTCSCLISYFWSTQRTFRGELPLTRRPRTRSVCSKRRSPSRVLPEDLARGVRYYTITGSFLFLQWFLRIQTINQTLCFWSQRSHLFLESRIWLYTVTTVEQEHNENGICAQCCCNQFRTFNVPRDQSDYCENTIIYARVDECMLPFYMHIKGQHLDYIDLFYMNAPAAR